MAKHNKLSPTLLPKMHLVCGTEQLRPAMMYVEIRNGIATATDAHILVRYDIRDLLPEDVLKFLDGKFIHREFWARMCKANELEINTMKVEGENIMLPVLKYGVLSKLSYKPQERDEIKFSDYMKVIPFDECMNDSNVVPSIGVKPRLLANLHEVAKSNREYHNSLNLHFNHPNRGILVTCDQNDRFLALIMPTFMNKRRSIDVFKS